ncbi:MAG: hydantoinase B/oxoprolinase family protein [Planctomycetota bacterium]|jgi:5-oxoprolinase (ATP-hydrolysing)
MITDHWKFYIDVGGTFTDVIARVPTGRIRPFKLLSSGVIRGTVDTVDSLTDFCDPARMGDPAGIWIGYDLDILDPDGRSTFQARIEDFDPAAGRICVARNRAMQLAPGMSYMISCHEPAPLVAIRYLMGRSLAEAIGPVEVQLGTTRATNALLERKGDRTALVTTSGFGDLLRIGNQDRPNLFEFNIRKRSELTECVIEITERLDADGKVLMPLDQARAAEQLAEARDRGIQAIAICLMHAHVNDAHEVAVAALAEQIGFRQVSMSSRVSRLEGIVSRGDTTVADAYLGSVIREYVVALRRSLPDARFRLMGSNGGLIQAEAVLGKDTILSGPAGGVVGCAFVSHRAGFERAISFDMGGTSTDVARVEPKPFPYEYQHETIKAGIRLKTPMIAVETVAAGGGSICCFDGQRLLVGPKSAGADPGPACYGRGGPLTITDVNLQLGRIVPERFPFPLDIASVGRRLDDIAAQIKRATGESLSAIDIAEGFLRIANEHIAAAIKEISIARGYDASSYALCSFGGAGSQHCCAIGEALGIQEIVISPYAGVLSAVGIGATDTRRIAERSILLPLESESTPRLESLANTMADQLLLSLGEQREQGIEGAVRHDTVDIRYVGQSTALTVIRGTTGEMRAAFESLHDRHYGYHHAGRSMEVCISRVQMTIAADVEALPSPVTETVASFGATRMYVGGSFRDVPVCNRAFFANERHLAGPAIVVDPTSTIIIDNGWSATGNEHGDLVLARAGEKNVATLESSKVDPIRLELFNRKFAAIADQMGATLRRTALSTNVKERLDYSCALFTESGALVVNAPHIPVHLGAMSDCVRALLEDVGTFAPGDVYVTNDPYRGGSHLNDVTVITPIHDEQTGDLVFFVASRAHHAEIGGTRPGSMPPDSTCLADEGVLIRAFPWVTQGRSQESKLRALLAGGPWPSRCPDDNIADIAAAAAANNKGARELRELMRVHSRQVVKAYMGHIQNAAADKMRAALEKVGQGTYRFDDAMDDGTAVRVKIVVGDGFATVDFGGTDSVHAGNLNANRAIVTSAVLYCLRCLIDEDIPLNAGVLEPVEIVLPECFLNPPSHEDPRHCPAMVGGNVETSQRIVDCILGALKVAAASQGTMNNVLLGDRDFGYYETICGGSGACDGFAGADAVHTHMTNTRMTDPEVLEARYPLRLRQFRINRGSGGPGLYGGGNGVIREIEALRPLSLSILSQRRNRGPYGIGRGEPGSPGENLLYRAGQDQPEVLPAIAQAELDTGDRVVIKTPGGGGWGAVS